MRECGEPEALLKKRILREWDPFTDQLYDIPGKVMLPASYSRFVVDLNRERNRRDPNGVIKSTDFHLRPLYGPDYRIDAEERERRLREYYDPYHRGIENILEGGDIRFLLDGHSMTAQGPAMGPDEGRSRPALCLCNFGDEEGNILAEEPLSLNPILARKARDHAAKLIRIAFPDWDQNNLALLNQPFDGGHVLRRYTHPAFPYHVPGLMFEINRALYLDEESVEPLPGAVEVRRGIVSEIASLVVAALDR